MLQQMGRAGLTRAAFIPMQRPRAYPAHQPKGPPMTDQDTALQDTKPDPAANTAANTAAEKARVRLILLVTLFALILWGLSIAAFGIPGLYIPALVAVPVIFVLLLLISRG